MNQPPTSRHPESNVEPEPARVHLERVNPSGEKYIDRKEYDQVDVHRSGAIKCVNYGEDGPDWYSPLAWHTVEYMEP